MKRLSYSVEIHASQERVWDNLLDPDHYREWAGAFSPNSSYQGQWKQGDHITFTDPDLGGTKAYIEKLARPSIIRLRHVGVISRDGVEDTESESARKWIGCTETYNLRELGDRTELRVTMNVHEQFEPMFNDCWPKALGILMEICERA